MRVTQEILIPNLVNHQMAKGKITDYCIVETPGVKFIIEATVAGTERILVRTEHVMTL